MTEENIVHLDPWYQFILNKVYNTPMKIKTEKICPVRFLDRDFTGELEKRVPVEFIEQRLDYDFYTDEVIELERLADPIKILPQDGLRYSIINIMGYLLDKLMDKAMNRYTKNANSQEEGRECLMIMKNEFLFKTLLLTESKKTYASIIELQEGKMVGGKMDIKGLSIDKATLNDKARNRFKKILAEEILQRDDIDQLQVLKEIALMEKEILNSLKSGSKEYYKPVSIKSMGSYDDPMGQQGIKASVVWNTLKGEGYEGIDMTKRNSVDVIKVNINPKNVEELKEIDERMYNECVKLFEEKVFKKGITTIAIPVNVETPEWVVPFIDYKTIINDNLTNFKKPLESVGIQMFGRNNINYTNIISL